MNRNNNIRIYSLCVIFVCLFGLLLSSCVGVDPPLPKNYKRVILIYMPGNTSDGIGGDLQRNLNDMEAGYIPPIGNNNVLLVYSHMRGKEPCLVRFSKDSKFAVIKDTLFRYSSQSSSTDPAVLQAVLRQVKEEFPAEEYGLIMSSHGTGWLPDNYMSRAGRAYSIDPYAHLVRTFGADLNGPGMEVTDLKNAIPYHLTFLMFDCCFMGGIEVAYELREKADYIIGSPAEILIKGFPFDKIMRPLFESAQDVAKVCEEYYDFYNNYTNRAATISLFKSSEMEALATVCSQIFENNRAKIRAVNRNTIQQYYRTGRPERYFWDLGDFIESIATGSEYNTFQSVLERAIPVKYNTSEFLNLVIRTYSGASTYIPAATPESVEAMYKGLEWNIDSGMIK